MGKGLNRGLLNSIPMIKPIYFLRQGANRCIASVGALPPMGYC